MAFFDGPKNVLSDLPTIPEFFKEKTILITGGTGFIGKLLIEKLLYSCPDLKQIYVFVRDKKGVFPEKRLMDMYNNNMCFERLRREKDGLFQAKVKAIAGDMMHENLGLSEYDRDLVTKTTDVLIHSAASVRFNDALEDAFKMNVMSTLQLLELAKKMDNLKSYVHISTAFCNIKFGEAIEEKIYPPRADWRAIKDICYSADNIDELQALTPKLLGEYPNTYVFTKHLAEQVVSEHRGRLPIVIVRPSVVTGCLEEPIPGWVDNFNGPVGICVASAQGVLRVLYSDKESKQDYIAGDAVTKGILIATWVRGIKSLHANDEIPVYNACGGFENSMTTKDLMSLGEYVTPRVAFEDTFRPMSLSFIKWKFLYKFYVFLTHVLPALAVDMLYRLIGRKPMLLRIQRKIVGGNLAMEAFMIRPWLFANDKFVALRSTLKPQDRGAFDFTLKGVNTREFLLNLGFRARKDLLHQDEKSLKKWRTIYKWEVIIDRIVRYIFYACVSWWMVTRYFNTILP